jgi:hypothetical protein
MTNGAVIFAQNNKNIDYLKLAVFAATHLKKHLDIPVSIITDSPDWLKSQYPKNPFDKIIHVDLDYKVLQHKIVASQHKVFFDGSLFNKKLEWKNSVRDQVFDLTPYDQTLVIDSDYIINSATIKPAFDNDYDLQIYRYSMDLAEHRPTKEFEKINQWSIPFYWATAFIFKKNSVTQAFFDLVAYIKANWLYFRTLYSIDTTTFRNDFAFSIAIHIMNGKTNGGFAIELPGKMIYSTDRDLLLNIEGNKVRLLVERKNFLGEYTLVKTTGLDVHVMNKSSLGRYIDGGSGV